MERFVWISKSVGQTHDFATRLIQVFCFHTQSPRKQRMQEAVRWLTSKLLIANRFSTWCKIRDPSQLVIGGHHSISLTTLNAVPRFPKVDRLNSVGSGHRLHFSEMRSAFKRIPRGHGIDRVLTGQRQSKLQVTRKLLLFAQTSQNPREIFTTLPQNRAIQCIIRVHKI